MSDTAFFRIKKLTGAGIITTAARHNRRAIAAERSSAANIDPTRTNLNYTIAGPGSAEAVAELAKERTKMAGITKKPRKDGVRALEAVFSVPAGTGIDHREYFKECVAWTATRFGGKKNILSADVHLDEAHPHLHVLILPIREGRMDGSNMVGGPSHLREHMRTFVEAVATPHGLSARQSLTTMDKATAAKLVIATLRTKSDPAMRSVAWDIVRTTIENDPGPWLDTLGLDLPSAQPKKLRTMAEIFTSPGKGPKRVAAGANV